MSCLEQILDEKNKANEYATHEDFCRVFIEGMDILYQLAFLLTGDEDMAQQCFVAGLGDSVKANKVFQDWTYSWAKRTIIKNAIRALNPQPRAADSSAPASAVSEKNKLRIIRDGRLEIDSVLALEDFERFVYVMTVLERYSDHDAALLIGCSIEQVRAARIRALEEITRIACNAPFYNAETERESNQLNLGISAEDEPKKTPEPDAASLVA